MRGTYNYEALMKAYLQRMTSNLPAVLVQDVFLVSSGHTKRRKSLGRHPPW